MNMYQVWHALHTRMYDCQYGVWLRTYLVWYMIQGSPSRCGWREIPGVTRIERDTQVTQSQLLLEETWSMGCCIVAQRKYQVLVVRVVPGNQQELLLSTTGIIYFEHCSSININSSTFNMFTYHITHASHPPVCNVNSRMEVVHTTLLCNCCCTVAATYQRAWELEARCDTDIIRQQQH